MLRLYFEAKTNKDYVMINTAKFKLPSGSIIGIDRDTSYYDNESGDLSMEWRGCYLWCVDDICIFNGQSAYLNDDAVELLKGAKLVELELEDDADEDYFVKCTEWRVE